MTSEDTHQLNRQNSVKIPGEFLADTFAMCSNKWPDFLSKEAITRSFVFLLAVLRTVGTHSLSDDGCGEEIALV